MTQLRRSFVAALPGIIVAISWSGFWLYLGGLDLVGVDTRTAYTAVVYAIIAVGLGATIWLRRDILVRRLERSSTVTRVWLASAVIFAALFAYGALVTGHGPLAHRLLGVFVISTIPTTITIAALSPQDLRYVRTTLVALGLAFLVVNLVASRHGAVAGGRFSPIAHLDPISAALVSIVACLAALSYRFRSRRDTAIQAAICFALAASSMLNGARGPALALIVAVTVLVLVERRPATILVALAVVAGIAGGSKLENVVIGQQAALSSLVGEATQSNNAPGAPGATNNTGPVPISSFHIRREWLSSALHQIHRKPLLGNGIGTLVDNTPEAAAMGVKGEFVYPHNDLVESFYSLGAIGGVLFAVLVAIPIGRLWRRRGRLDPSLAGFIIALFAFAFAECNFSGEIGTDVILWSVASFAVLACDQPELSAPA